MDAQLLAEFDETVALVKQARAEMLAEPYIEGQRGGAKPSPWVTILRDAQAHLARMARILTLRGLEVPVAEDEFQKLLD